MARAEKVAAVAELTERFQSSSGAVLTEYRGLSVAQLGELRRSLGEHATFAVVKNTLTKIAANDAGVAAELTELLSGPSAIAFVQGDVVEAAKGLRDFSRANPFLVIKGGVLDGKVMTPDEIVKLADLEPREVLLAKLAGAMKASLSNAAATFAALPTQMARLLAALEAKQAEAQGGAAAQEGARGPGRRPGPGATPGPGHAGQARRGPGQADRASGQRRLEHQGHAGDAGHRHDVAETGTGRGSTTMAKLSNDALLDAFKEMTLLELSEFVKQFEDTFDVKAAAPVAVAGPAQAGGGARRRGGRGEGRVRRHPRGRGRQEDPGHQGGPDADQPGPQGGQGPGGRRAEARARARQQGGRGQGQGCPGGRRRHGHGQVTHGQPASARPGAARLLARGARQQCRWPAGGVLRPGRGADQQARGPKDVGYPVRMEAKP